VFFFLEPPDSSQHDARIQGLENEIRQWIYLFSGLPREKAIQGKLQRMHGAHYTVGITGFKIC